VDWGSSALLRPVLRERGMQASHISTTSNEFPVSLR
jgi:hypothetical protein